MKDKKVTEINVVKQYYKDEIKRANMILNLKGSVGLIDNQKEIIESYEKAFKRALMRANLINDDHFLY